MNLGELLTYINFISTKENRGMTYTPEMFNTNLPVAVLEIVNEEYELYEKTKKISDNLSPYIKEMGGVNSPLVVDTNGYAQKPEDYLHHCTMEYKYLTDVWIGNICNVGIKTKNIEFCTANKFSYKKSSSISPPTKKYPIVCERNTYFEFLPTDLEYVDFVYISKPETPIFDYYIDADGDIIYLLPNTRYQLQAGETGSAGQTLVWVYSNSVETLLPVNLHIKLAQKLLIKVGINLRDLELVQYTKLLNNEKD